jgi:hypothetical protein
MRKILAALLAFTTLSASGQQPAQQPVPPPPAGSNWQHVQTLPNGQSIIVNARTSHASCTLKSVDAGTLTCTHGKDIIFQRTDIVTIKIPRRGRSAAVGLGIGAGAGAGIGAASCHDSWSLVCAVGFGIYSAGAGLLVGVLTDFDKSTVYKAP